MMSEQEQLEKKRPGPAASPFEKQKRPKKEVDDWLFYESDNDTDCEFVKKANDDDDCDDSFLYEGDSDSDDFTITYKYHEGGHSEAPKNEDEAKDGKRRCLEVCVCNDYQHVAKFKGSPIFEIFKVKLKLNDSNPIFGGKLYGEIAKLDSEYDLDNPIPISYYRASHKKPEIINLNSDNQFVLLPLSGPNIRPPFFEDYCLCIDFAFKLDGKDIFTDGFDVENRELFDDGCGYYTAKVDSISLRPFSLWECSRDGNYLARRLIGEPTTDRIILGVYTGLFYGSWATVSVKMLPDGVSRFYGLIVARPCVFNTRFRLLTVQRDNNKPEIEQHGKGEVDEESRLIKLTRSVVSVPSYSSLIIGAALYDEDGTSHICRGKTAFAAKPFGAEVKCISSNGVKSLLVRVEWNRTKST